MKLPSWLSPLGKRDEQQRAAAGLFARRDGWYKTIGGKTRYVCKPCPLADALALLPARLQAIADTAAHVPAPAGELTVLQGFDLYMAHQRQRLETGRPRKLSRRTYDDKQDVLFRFVESTGAGKRWGQVSGEDFGRFLKSIAGRAQTTIRREMIYVDALVNWLGPGKGTANRIGVVQRGPDWIKPSLDELLAQAADNDKAYTLKELRAAFKSARKWPMLHAAACLGFGCGFIPKDIATLREENVLLDRAKPVIVFPRGKTGVSRVCPLLPPMVRSLERYMARRSKRCAPEAKGLVFRTRHGNPLARSRPLREDPGREREENQIVKRWSKVIGQPFTGLRSTFATLVDDWPDQRAIDMVLGHKAGKASTHIRVRFYAKKFKVSRARRVVAYAWRQAFGHKSKAPKDAPAATGDGSDWQASE